MKGLVMILKSGLRYVLVVLTLLSIALFSGCEISGEIPELDFFLNKEWKIEKVTVNGLDQTDEDLSLYRLQLNEDLTFSETSIPGNQQAGTWSLDNNGTILTLEYEDGSELRFIISDIQIRSLVLSVIQSEDKIGSLDIVYHLIPVKV